MSDSFEENVIFSLRYNKRVYSIKVALTYLLSLNLYYILSFGENTVEESDGSVFEGMRLPFADFLRLFFRQLPIAKIFKILVSVILF